MLNQLVVFAQTLDYSKLPKAKADDALLKTSLTIVFTILGAVAVMMVVIGAIKYGSSQGDPSAISSAKNTILYSIIGLVVCIFAISIVSFVIGRVA